MKWEEVTLKDICKIKSGKRLPQGTSFALHKTDYPYIRARDIKAGVIDGSELAYLDEDVQRSISKYIVNAGDIVITIVGASVGDVGYVELDFNGFNLTENAVRLTDFNEKINSRYLLYVLNSEKYRELMQQIAGGSAQPKLGIYKLESIPLNIPPVDNQNKIADTLSAYDDLIENNQKQIKLLEEAAQRLYKEWFVGLRFPGHENVEIVDGLPSGWSKQKAIDVFDITIGRTPPRSQSEWFTKNNDGLAWVSIADMGNSNLFILETNESLTDDAVKIFNVPVVPKGTVLLSFKLTVGRVTIASKKLCTNEAIAHFRLNDESFREYIYFYLKNFNYDILGNTSAISKAINSTIVKNMDVVLPDKSVLSKFHALVESIFDKIEILQSEIKHLKEARDRLLPKLMSGEVEV